MLKKLLFVITLCTFEQVHAQITPMNIENISDDQLLQLITQYQLSGLSESEVEIKAREKGMSTDQILILKKRMALLDPTSGFGVPPNATYNNKNDGYLERNRILTRGPGIRKKDSTGNTLYPFGDEWFDNQDFTFEPNPYVSSPTNFVIGVNDQLVVDVYGLSENTKKVKVTPDGFIRLQNLGPVRVAGLTLEAAKDKISRALTTIYPAIASGKTKVEVTLGHIRSIRITVIGEVQRPGNYTMSSLSTLLHALYACGGPNNIGSIRNVSLMRSGKNIVTMDVYDFLLNGDLSKNVLLQEDDVIRVGTYQTRIGIKGSVKKPALFDLKPGEHAGAVLQFAGGFSDKAMKDFIRIKRLGTTSREILTVPIEKLSSFELMSGDTLYVDSLVRRYANRVVISGSVNYPGEFGLNEVKDLSSLLKLAQPNPQAYADRAMLIRRKDESTPSYIPFSISEVMEGKLNVKLEQEDSVHILKTRDVRESYSVRINGEVNKPDTYAFAEGMRAQDLILLAGGLKDGASLQRIEISRRLRQESAQDTAAYAIIKSIDLKDGIGFHQSEIDVELKPFDIVSIRKSPSYKEQITVRVEGEVIFPGTYTLSGNKERLTDIIERAGGLKQTAFTNGGILARKTYQGTTNADAAIFSNKLNLVNNQQKGSSPILATTDTAQVRATLDNISSQHRPVAIRLDKALELPGSAEDLYLEEGDVLKVPRLVQTVQLFGAVNVPQQLAYTSGLSVRKMVRQSGGFTLQAARRKVYVVHPNGTVGSTRRFLFIKSYPRLIPGAEVYVPMKKEARKLSAGEIISFGTGLLSLGGLIIALMNSFK